MPRKDILSDSIRLQHMYDAICEAVGFIKKKTLADIEQDSQLALSLVKRN